MYMIYIPQTQCPPIYSPLNPKSSLEVIVGSTIACLDNDKS